MERWMTKLNGKILRSGAEAARKKFTPEFINRLDKIVTFRPLGTPELRKILDIELNMVQQRIFNTSPEKSFVFKTSDEAKDFLLREGTDLKYGARHLKRAIERLLVQPMSNLIATDQVRGGDCVYVDYDADAQRINVPQGSRGIGRQRHGRSGRSLHFHPGFRSCEWRLYRSCQNTKRSILQAGLEHVISAAFQRAVNRPRAISFSALSRAFSAP